jgi:tRNA threonylcarbamoyladenosine biosynthesis protein TsaE
MQRGDTSVKRIGPSGFLSESEEDTRKLGSYMAGFLRENGLRILLRGGLGVGKTVLVRGFCEALGFMKVRSPSFTLVNQYKAGDKTIIHSDLYRLESNDVEDLELDNGEEESTIVFVEWAEKGAFSSDFPTWELSFDTPAASISACERIITFRSLDREGERLLSSFICSVSEVISE